MAELKEKTMNFRLTGAEFEDYDSLCKNLGMNKSKAFAFLKEQYQLRSGNPVLVAQTIIENAEKEMLFLDGEQKNEVMKLLKSHYEKK